MNIFQQGILLCHAPQSSVVSEQAKEGEPHSHWLRDYMEGLPQSVPGAEWSQSPVADVGLSSGLERSP